MHETRRTAQRMIDWLEDNLDGEPQLGRMAWQLGYSSFHLTRRFHDCVGMTLREYVGRRRLTRAALMLRDTDAGVLDVAVACGFGSQQAFTRAFRRAYDASPAAWRRTPAPIPLLLRRIVFDPYYFGIGAQIMAYVKDIETRIERLPAHTFVGLRNIDAEDYWSFWELQDKVPGLDCYTATGLLESMGGHFGQVGGWFYENGRQGYLYGVQLDAGYAGAVPAGMLRLDLPDGEYAVFFHPPFNYEQDCGPVHERVMAAAAAWDPTPHGYEWDLSRPEYQRHDPEGYGEAVYKPLKRISE